MQTHERVCKICNLNKKKSSHKGIYTAYKTFLHKDKALIKRLLKVG